MKTIHTLLLLTLISFFSCSEEDAILPEEVVLSELTSGSVDFSNYVAIGASFTAGFTDGALFIASQENSFPNMLSKEFAKIGGGVLEQPLMNDNIGGFIGGSPRFYFYSDQDDTDDFDSGPYPLGIVPHIGDFTPESPTTDPSTNIFNSNNPFTNMGVTGAKSTHINFVGYGSSVGNPYFARMASSPAATILDDAIAQNPTFFTLTLMGGNDVLGYATNGGDDTDAITPSATFDFVFNEMVTKLLATGAKGVVTNVPYVEDLPHFTTVPYNPVPLDAATAAALNQGYALYNGGLLQALAALNGTGLFTAEEVAKRTISFSAGNGNALVIIDETLTNLGAINPAFAGIPQYRQATADDLFVLPLSSLIPQGYGTQIPLADKWVLLPSEQLEIKTATDAYNSTIATIANSNENIALVDLNAILSQLASTGINFDGFNLNADLVTGGAVSLDGIHLTARGYAYMANKFLEAIDNEFGTNFIASGNVVKANDYPTNYSATLQ